MLFTNEEDYNEYVNEVTGAVIYGDARRCPRHPGVKTSSDDGMFDGLCHICEGEMTIEAEMWDHNPENPKRQYCGNEVYIPILMSRAHLIQAAPVISGMTCAGKHCGSYTQYASPNQNDGSFLCYSCRQRPSYMVR